MNGCGVPANLLLIDKSVACPKSMPPLPPHFSVLGERAIHLRVFDDIREERRKRWKRAPFSILQTSIKKERYKRREVWQPSKMTRSVAAPEKRVTEICRRLFFAH